MSRCRTRSDTARRPEGRGRESLPPMAPKPGMEIELKSIVVSLWSGWDPRMPKPHSIFHARSGPAGGTKPRAARRAPIVEAFAHRRVAVGVAVRCGIPFPRNACPRLRPLQPLSGGSIFQRERTDSPARSSSVEKGAEEAAMRRDPEPPPPQKCTVHSLEPWAPRHRVDWCLLTSRGVDRGWPACLPACIPRCVLRTTGRQCNGRLSSTIGCAPYRLLCPLPLRRAPPALPPRP